MRRLKMKNIIISTDSEKLLDKIQYPFKTRNKVIHKFKLKWKEVEEVENSLI